MSTTATTNEYSTILRLMNLKPVSVPPIYKMLVGSFEGAVLLSQILYWHSVMGKIYYKTDQDFMAELFMTEREFKRAKIAIKNVPFVSVTRKGVPAKTHYNVNYDLMASTLKNVLISSDTRRPNWMVHPSSELDDTPVVQTITESTTENTTENISPSHSPSGSEDKTSAIKSKIFSAGKYDQAAVDLAEMIVASRRRQCPDAKNVNKDLEKTRSAWANDLDKMLRIDKRDPAEAKKVLGWALGDSFWEQNIQSGKKFRDKYDDLKIKMAPAKGPTGMIEI